MSDSMGKAVCEAASGGNEAVYEAASDGNEAELRRMIGLGGSVNWHHPGDGGFTALITATYWGHEGCFRLLLESEAIEVNATDDIGRSALHWAADFGRLAIAKRLLERGADLTLRNRDLYGKTALDDARKQGKSEVVALLSGPRYADGDRTECELNATRMRTE